MKSLMRPRVPNKLEARCPEFGKYKRAVIGTKISGGKACSPRTIVDVWLSDADEVMLALDDGSEERAMDVFKYHERPTKPVTETR